VDLNEDEEDEEEEGDEDDESTSEDEDLEEDSMAIDTRGKSGRKLKNESDESEDESDDSTGGDDEDEDDAEEEENISDNELSVEEDEEENEDALEALKGYIQNLEVDQTSGTKRKASELEESTESSPPKQKRRILKERTQPGEEGEFLASRGTGEYICSGNITHY
jgi:U3 small nucleolar RNA-associated protein 14